MNEWKCAKKEAVGKLPKEEEILKERGKEVADLAETKA